jgi:hypothetical protein
MRMAKVERHIAVSTLREQLQALRIDLQDLATIALNNFHIICGEKLILCGILLDWIGFLIDEISHSE